MHQHYIPLHEQTMPYRRDEQEFESFLTELFTGEFEEKLQDELAPLATDEKFPGNTIYPVINLGFKKSTTCLQKEAKKCIRTLNRNTTAIFYSTSFNPNQPVHLLFYFHGHLGKYPGNNSAASEYLNFAKNDYLDLRKEIEDSKKNVILIMPSLGTLSEPGILTDCGEFEEYLKKVKTEIEENILKKFSTTKMKKGKLILSGHSGGGKAMLSLATFNKVDEVWGFDSIYQGGKDWPCAAKRNKNMKLFFYYHQDGNGAKDGTASAIRKAKADAQLSKPGSLDNLVLIDVFNEPPKKETGNPYILFNKDPYPHFATIRAGLKKRLEALSGTTDGTDWESDFENESSLLDEVFGEMESEFDLTKVTPDFLMGHYEPSEIDFADFSIVEDRHLVKEKRGKKEKIFLLADVYKKFIEMYDDAAKECISLNIVSGIRNFNYQKEIIWNPKWNGDKKVNGKLLSKPGKKEPLPKQISRAQAIMIESAMPGTSRHHWGTDVDMISVESSYFESGSGRCAYNWLVKNASKYGFCQPYTKKSDRPGQGYAEEKWHWSYKPFSEPLLKLYLDKIKAEDIKDFLGDNVVPHIGVMDFVKNINSACK